MSLNYLRSRVDALRRKMALALVVVELQPAAEELCDQWSIADANRQPLPESRPLVDLMIRRGHRLPNLLGLYSYIDSCRTNGDPLLPHKVLQALLPWHAAAGYLGPA